MADTSIFTRLKRLFSTDVIIRNIGGDSLKVVDVNSIQRNGEIETNSLIDRFNRVYSTSPTSLYGHQSSLNYQIFRTQLYSEYDVMDSDAIIASSLDIVADECTLKNDMGEVLQIRSSDDTVQKLLYNLFYDVLNIEFNLWTWVRNMCKYGDFFLKLEIADKYGVYNVIPYSAYHIERQEGYDPKNPASVRFRYDPDGVSTSGQYHVPNQTSINSKSILFDNYEVAHFRLLADTNFLPYGRAYIEPARKLYKQYALMEDAMLIHRIVRAPEKRVFYVNIGGIPPSEVDNFMEKTVTKMKRTPYIDPQTGEYNLKYNMQNMLEDFYIPVRGNDATTKIDTTKGLEYAGIEDVQYLRDKLFAALKVPKAFMGYEKDLTGKATLAAEDIRFARTIDRIQRIIISELYKIALVHLYTQGYRDAGLTNFELSMTTPSIIYDQERIALMREKVGLAKDALDSKLLPSDWVYKNIFHFSEDEFDDYRDLTREDAKRAFRLTQIENEGNDPTESGKSYGTPHDLASLYGTGRMQSDPANVPTGYDQDRNFRKLGRPEEKSSFMNTQQDPLGRDRLGRQSNKVDDSDESRLREDSKIEYLKNRQLLESLGSKKLASGLEKINFLDENNIKE